MFDSTTARAHVSAAGAKGVGRASARPLEAVSRPRFPKADHDGLPNDFDLTPRQASDSRHFPVLLELGPDITPRAGVGDKGYDSVANLSAASTRSICPVISVKSTAKIKPSFFARPPTTCRLRCN